MPLVVICHFGFSSLVASLSVVLLVCLLCYFCTLYPYLVLASCWILVVLDSTKISSAKLFVSCIFLCLVVVLSDLVLTITPTPLVS